MNRILVVAIMIVFLAGCGGDDEQALADQYQQGYELGYQHALVQVQELGSARAGMDFVELMAVAKRHEVVELPCRLTDVALSLARLGLEIMPSGDSWDHPTWEPGSGEQDYWLCRATFAVGTPEAVMMLRNASGPYCMQVAGFKTGLPISPWSDIGWSDNGDGSNALPGLQELMQE